MTSPTITDLFCGAGGSSLGATAAGYSVDLALNHWPTGVEVHRINHPDTKHEVCDVSVTDPRRYRPTDVAWMSPSCVGHSRARGARKDTDPSTALTDAEREKRYAHERARATMWDVPRWTEVHRYRAVVVENVVEATSWQLWPAWWQAMELLGYTGEVLSLNSQFFGATPQSRDRIYVVWTAAGVNRPDLTFAPAAWCAPCGRIVGAAQSWRNGRTVGRYAQQYRYTCPECATPVRPAYTPASAAIDLSIPPGIIGERVRPLAAATRARIAAGVARYASRSGIAHAPDPACTVASHLWASRHRPSVPQAVDPDAAGDAPIAVTGSGPAAIVMRNNKGGAEMSTPLDEPLRTLTTAGHQSVVTIPPSLHGVSHPGDVDVDACGLRMLEPHEAAAGMAMSAHPDGRPYELLGTKRDRLRSVGNAVTPPVAAALLERIRSVL
ncbi:hypothetical protein DVS28_b0543 (plasmid) [Euzebya pacifica]|uniref:DNA (cytosine-5-)-methyltransferase n=1 Tax=Euzebya pacifica TaxID=1608957 RepID=A0A346Y736_9ACTN|nr:DNA cytosine methyltransferase [Euzebya pacifica]AXV10283.1 hypothetical protein DVS28_b0543 [Euzebya pacifica]